MLGEIYNTDRVLWNKKFSTGRNSDIGLAYDPPKCSAINETPVHAAQHTTF